MIPELKLKYLAALFFALMICGVLQGAASPADAAKKITEQCGKVYRLVNRSPFKIANQEITAEPFTAYRLFYQGHPLKELKVPSSANAAQAKEYERPAFADIVLIPVDSPFRLDKALKYSRPTTEKETAFLLFRQFGMEWRDLKNLSSLHSYTVYVGKNDDWYCFASANTSFLLMLQDTLKLKDGFVPMELLAEALFAADVANVTADTAMHMLAGYGNQALPHLDRAIQEAASLDDDTYRPFFALSQINTPEAFAMINRYAEQTTDRNVLASLFRVILLNKVVSPALKPCYQKMLEHQAGVEELIRIYTQLGWADDLRKGCALIAETPKTYENYRQAVFYLEKVDAFLLKRYGDLEESIRQLLLRSGDMPKSIAYHTVSETETEREIRLRKEDEKRIAPMRMALLGGPKPKITIISALNLALMDDSNAPQSVKNYVARVRNVGLQILRDMPDKRDEISHTLRTLVTHSTVEREQRLLSELAVRLRIQVPTR